MNELERRRAIGTALSRMNGETRVQSIPSGWEALDQALGTRGWPRGRITEIFGPEACGKTTLALRAIAEAQKAGGTAAFIDADHTLEVERARSLGVDAETLLLVRPRCGEEAMEIAARLVSSRALDLLAVDSVAALAPRLELASSLDADLGALHSRMMSQAVRRLAMASGRTAACLLFLNQIRIRSDEMETTAGGYAVRLHASIRVELRPASGAGVEARVVKNRLAPAFRAAVFVL